MIYLFTGSDTNKVRAKAFAWVEASRKKQPDAPYRRIAAEEVSESALMDAVAAQGLFFSKSLVLLDDPFSLKESGETVLESLQALAASPNPVGILAPKLHAAHMKKLEAAAEKTFKIDAVKKEARGFNGGLVNALAVKDGQKLWEEIVRASRAGDAPEMLHGLLHWKARDLMEKGSRAWTEKEARGLSLALIELLSDARSESLDLSVALERFALSL
jgi:DNA polymerase III delta subunit